MEFCDAGVCRNGGGRGDGDQRGGHHPKNEGKLLWKSGQKEVVVEECDLWKIRVGVRQLYGWRSQSDHPSFPVTQTTEKSDVIGWL